eukprot:TRINITY_DN7891_c0_g1_i4.p1 TRINITY_DN7891_c0_g1~~TRINITY_DN7891_c0_g1_i4.p1  ORF type:complete len:241 (-),score=23.45 TRINITY_DN7891_c0_g1_i4:86-808(-)
MCIRDRIRTHAQNFCIKIEKLADYIDPIKFIKEKPTDFFLSKEFQNGLIVKKPPSVGGHEGKAARSGSKKRESERRDCGKESEKCNDLKGSCEESKDRHDKIHHLRPSTHPRTKTNSLFNIVEPQKKSMPTVQPLEQSLSCISEKAYQYYLLMQQLTEIQERVESEYSSVKGILCSDKEFEKYWNAIHKASTSLKNMVNDLAYMHMYKLDKPFGDHSTCWQNWLVTISKGHCRGCLVVLY